MVRDQPRFPPDAPWKADPPAVYSLLLAIIYIAFVSLGLPDSLIGAGWPVMHRDLGVPIASAGIITMIIAGGTILSSLASERITRRFGVGVVTAVSVGHDGRGSRRLLRLRIVLDAVPVGHSIRPGRGGRRRRSEQLRRGALRRAAYELAARVLGSGRLDQPVHHELRARLGVGLVQRLPDHRPDPSGAHVRTSHQHPAVAQGQPDHPQRPR